ncbi:MAG: ZIP family metal transporter [Minisyncoccia bacterium]
MFDDKYHLLLGITAGMLFVLLVTDLGPTALAIPGYGSISGVIGLVLGFLLFRKHNHVTEHDYDEHHNPSVAGKDDKLGRMFGFIMHSALDGFGIAVLTAIGNAPGLLGLLAFLPHRISDGFTASLMLRRMWAAPKPYKVFKSILFIACSPILGVLAYWVLQGYVDSEISIAIGSGLAFGFFTILIFKELVPELMQEKHPRQPTLIAAFTGMVIMYLLVNFI